MQPPPLIPPGPARRRAGTWLVVYGVAGLLVLGVLAAAMGVAAFMGRDGYEDVDAALGEVEAVLSTTQEALTAGADTVEGVSISLGEAAVALDQAATVSGDLASAATTVADTAVAFDIFGQRPFGALEGPFRVAGTSLSDLTDRIVVVGDALGRNSSDTALLAERLDGVAGSIGATADRVAAVDPSLGIAAVIAFLVILAILGWLMVPAVAAIWIGLRWRRENPPA